MRHVRLSLLCCLTWAMTAPAAAYGQSGKDPVNLPDPGDDPPALDGGAMMLRTFVALLVTVGVIYAVYRLVKALNRGTQGALATPAVEVMSRTQLDRDMIVYVTRVGDDVSVLLRTKDNATQIVQMPLAEAHSLGLTTSTAPAKETVGNLVAHIKTKLRRPGRTPDAVSVDDLLSAQATRRQERP